MHEKLYEIQLESPHSTLTKYLIFNIESCNLQNSSIKILTKCFWPHLNSLNLQSNQEQLQCFSINSLINSGWPNLTSLCLSRIPLTQITIQ